MSAAFDRAVADAARGGAPLGIALMRLLGEAVSEADAQAGLARAMATARQESDAATLVRLVALRRFWAEHPQAWAVVHDVFALVDHGEAEADPDQTLARLAHAFDRLAAARPEAGVALYALGSPELLAAATAEVVAAMDRLGLLHPAFDALDFGCGIGRFLAALAPRLRTLVGLDLSAGMVGQARARCASFGNVEVAQGNGRDLTQLADASLDLVLAADVFPYLVQAGGDLAARHLVAFARVLRPGGAAFLLNYRYGDPAHEPAEVDAAARAAGLALERVGRAEFTTWDAASYLLRR